MDKPPRVSAAERVLPRASAAYIFAGGRGPAAYTLNRLINGKERT